MFESIDDVSRRFAEQKYICNRNIATVVYLAARMGKPILVEGPAGVGKTELAKVLSGALGEELIRLQCYEGLDEAKALYEWEYGKQLLYTQILKDKIGEVLAGTGTLAEAVDRISKQDGIFFSEKFILLEILSDFQVSVPELGTISARHIPIVILTSNNSRELSDALKRRCLHLFIDFPSASHELEIIKLKVPELREALAEDVVAIVQSVRKLDLKKSPSISETLDWARALAILNVESLGEEIVTDTLATIFKHEGDIRKAQGEMRDFVARQKAKAPRPEGGANPDDKDVLH